MITKGEWDIIARCVARNPSEETSTILKKLSTLAQGNISEVTCLDSYGKLTKKVIIEFEDVD
tara:strand:- start:101 stop:286 length:186 start_codon:yes stop_codon:yes gene_type:complete